MSEFKLTKSADADLLKIFLYGFETFGRAQAEEYVIAHPWFEVGGAGREI